MKFQSLQTHTHTNTHTHTHTHIHIHIHKHKDTNTKKHTHTQTNKQTQNIYFTSTDKTRCRQSVITFAVQQQFYRAMSLLWLLVSVLSTRMPGFRSSQVCIGFIVHKSGFEFGSSQNTTVFTCRYHSTDFLHPFSHPTPTQCKSNLSISQFK